MTNDDNQPFLSVWIVAYNHGKFIRKCLESVMMQRTSFKFEVIIGEDCSTDNTREIIREFEAKYPEIIKPIYHEKNVGAYSNAYEHCYPKLKGKYIACLEADDYWTYEHKLQLQVDALEADASAVACFTKVKVLNEDDHTFSDHWSTAYNVKKRYSVTDVLKKFNIVTCSLLFKNVHPGQLPYNPADFATGDVSLSVFLLLKGDAIYIDKLTAVYRLHNSGTYSSQTLEKKNLVFVQLFQQFLKEPLLRKYRPLLKELLSDRAYQAMCFEIKKEQPDRTKISEYYKLALREASYSNLFFPIKAFLRKNLYQITGKAYGRKL